MSKRETKQVQIAVRFTTEMLDRIDTYAGQLQADLDATHPGLTASRADAVRVLVLRGLEASRGDRGKRSPTPK